MKKLLYILIVFSVMLASFGFSTQAFAADSVKIVSVDYPHVVGPGKTIPFKVKVEVKSGQLLESRGDMLRNTNEQSFGHWPHIAVKGIVNTGDSYIFESYGDGLIAPMAEGTYHSRWKVWQNGAYVEGEVDIAFQVQNGAGGGDPPVPPPYKDSGSPCKVNKAVPYERIEHGKLEHSIELTIPYGDVQTTVIEIKDFWGRKSPRTVGAHSNIKQLNDDREPVDKWTVGDYETYKDDKDAPLKPGDWRIYVPTHIVGTWGRGWAYNGEMRKMFLNHPENMAYLICKNQITLTSYDQWAPILRNLAIVSPMSGTQLTHQIEISSWMSYIQTSLPVLRSLAIVSPISGTRLTYQVEIPSWMSYIQTSLNIGSKATITLIAPDGTVYSPTNSAVTYVDTPSFAVHTLNLDSPKGGTWQVVIDVIAAESDSVFMLNVYGKQINVPSNDNIPPVTGMHFDGTKGQNAWFTSDVTVTLSAEDNPGGSGVKGMEWSMDNGATWQIYTSPFVINQEGLSYVLGRSYDNAGNYDQSPIGKFLQIDKTPPVVNVSTDQTEYTRVQPFVVHYNCTDPEPGSGIADCTATFNGQSVSDGQSIDMFWWKLGQYTLTATGVDNAGWTTTNSKTIKLIATIQSLQKTVERLCAEKYITKQGICMSLQQKLRAALSAQQRGQKATAANILRAFQNEITAQKGKAVKVQAYDLLMMDSNYVISTLGGKK